MLKLLRAATGLAAFGLPMVPVVAHAQSQFPVALRWEGYVEPVTGTARPGESDAAGSMILALPRQEGTCQGRYQDAPGGRKGAWAAGCTNGVAISGTYERNAVGAGAVGDGVDSMGRKVAFALGGDDAKPAADPALAPAAADRFEGKWEWRIESTNTFCSAFSKPDPFRIAGGKMEGSLFHVQTGNYRMDIKVSRDGKAAGYFLGSQVVIRLAGAFTPSTGEGDLEVSGTNICVARWYAKRLP
ncbi:MAG: hypothetical protein HZC25_13325 [Rhodospirillales bacterium]|nr:hypothetical protein [Rhodospirillales bacterium]